MTDQATMDSLRSSADMWKNVSWRLTDDMLNVRILQLFMQQVEGSLKKGSPNALKDAVAWLKKNYPDDPKTQSIDESVSYDDLANLMKKLGIEQPKDSSDVNEINSKLKNIKDEFVRIYAMREVANQQVDDTFRRIEDAHAAQESSEVDGESKNSGDEIA